jgi:hypothetical protein
LLRSIDISLIEVVPDRGGPQTTKLLATTEIAHWLGSFGGDTHPDGGSELRSESHKPGIGVAFRRTGFARR